MLLMGCTVTQSVLSFFDRVFFFFLGDLIFFVAEKQNVTLAPPSVAGTKGLTQSKVNNLSKQILYKRSNLSALGLITRSFAHCF